MPMIGAAVQSNVSVSQEYSLAGRLRRLRLFPGFTLSGRLGLARLVHRRRTRRAGAELRHLGFDRLAVAKDPAALAQDPADLLFLYQAVHARRPIRVLEFGSGQSTLFIAQALRDAGSGHLFSLDADARWLRHSAEMLPKDLKPFVTFVHSPVILNEEYGVPTWQYSVVPEGNWDFVLVDGPEGTRQSTLSCDLVKLVPALNPGAFGMIDHRWRTAVLAKEVVGERLRFRFVPSLESFVFELRPVD